MRESRYNVWAQVEGAHYVFNAATGALLRVLPEEHAAVERFLATRGGEPCPLPLLLAFAREGILVAREADEVAALRVRYERATQDLSHLSLVILTSLGCNFACPYCWETKRLSLMGHDVQRSVLRYVDDRLPGLASLEVAWFGGEPLLGQAALFSLSAAFMERCAAAGVSYTADIMTNGYLLDEPTCRRLAEHGVRHAQITLDGPPEIHDARRPLAGGQGTFWRIVENLHHATDHFEVVVRVNVDGRTNDGVSALLAILTAEGLAGRLTVYPGHLRWDVAARSTLPGCAGQCLARLEFARLSHEIEKLAAATGFAAPSLPTPVGVYCAAAHAGDLVVGSAGELYACEGQAGNPHVVVGHIDSYFGANARTSAFRDHDPFADAECHACIALPVCMGGCPRDAVASNPAVRANRCHEYRYMHREIVLRCAEAEEARSAEAGPQIT